MVSPDRRVQLDAADRVQLRGGRRLALAARWLPLGVSDEERHYEAWVGSVLRDLGPSEIDPAAALLQQQLCLDSERPALFDPRAAAERPAGSTSAAA